MNSVVQNCQVRTPKNVTWYGVLAEEFQKEFSIWSSHTHTYVVVPKEWVTFF
jgi:uncharacterized protein YukE